MADTDKISQRAHEIWEREGRPDGQSERHWREAAASLAVPEPGAANKPSATKADKPGEAKAGAKAKKADKQDKADAAAKPAKKKKAADDAKGDAKRAEPGKKKSSGKGAKKAG